MLTDTLWRYSRRVWGIALAGVLTAPPPAAAQADAFDLSIASIMRGPELVGRVPSDVRWSADGRWIYFNWLEPGSPWYDPLAPFRVEARAGAVPERLTDAQMDTLGPLAARGHRSPDGQQQAVAFRGDLYVVTLGTDVVRRLTRTAAEERDPRFLSDGQRIAYRRGANAYVVDLRDGTVTQLTDFVFGPPPEDSAAEGQAGFLERQQGELFESIRIEAARDSVAEARRDDRRRRRMPPTYLDDDESVADLVVSPDGRWAVVVATTPSTDHRSTAVPRWVTEDGYVEEESARRKVGDVRTQRRVGLLDLASGEVTWHLTAPEDTAESAMDISVLD